MANQVILSGLEPPEYLEMSFLESIRGRLETSVKNNGGEYSLLSIKTTKPTSSKSSGYTAVKLGSFTSFRLKLRGKQHYISIHTAFSDLIPSHYPQKRVSSDLKYLRILVDTNHPIETYADFLISIVGETVNRYPKEWDCCSLYLECSNAKTCVLADKALALNCGYRKILNSGRIFYGTNRNID